MLQARMLIGDDLVGVNALIVERMESEVPLIPELARHLIAAGGKRIRPVLTLLAARLCGYAGDRHVALAACVEFIHTATLLHDDVVDESDLRRGRSTANALWGNKAPVLVGDFLFSRAFELMVSDGSLRVLEILSNASAVIAEGEVAQLVTANDMSTDEDAYFNVIRSKTAALFRAASRIGAVVAGRPHEEEVALAAFGEELGIAFQLVDDALDYAARQALLGKTVGDDFVDGKVTLPAIIAYREGNEDERSFWRRTMEEQVQSPGDLKQAQAFLARHRAIERTIDRAIEAGQRARDSLSIFPDNPTRRAMLDLVDFATRRAF
ncbi:MAG: polyprenyl synthetase family protein [Geminicoccaceae bacterium]|nr:polyprenyl synthetase family protein [Geminicoccaceae bacterium]